MFRSIKVLIDSASWQPTNVPINISSMKGKWEANMLIALFYTALWTRPPVTYGFHLSDLWAWFRYCRAISATSALKLCSEWETIDSHQKTILSDELGVGLTTYLLTERLGCLYFIDTLYFIKMFPKKFSFSRFTRKGKYKSPDYIGLDANLNYYILECKGTQTSQKALQSAINKGKTQKNNLTGGTGTKLIYSLVVGLFIARWGSKEKSCIIISDPTWDELEEFLNEYPPEEVNAAIAQIALAKHFSLIGLSNLAQILAETPTDNIELSDAARIEIDAWLETQPSDGFRTIFNTEDVYPNVPGTESSFLQGRFLVRTPDYFLAELRDSRTVGELLREFYRLSMTPPRDTNWLSFSSEVRADLASPLGFKFRLEVS